jgi:hypothetical protein
VDNIFPKKVVCPDEVVEYIKHQKPLSQEPLLTECDTTTSSPVDNTQKTVKQTTVTNPLDDLKELNNPLIDEANQPVIQFPAFENDCSLKTLARFSVDNDLITFVPQQGAFVVQGRKGKYCVTLFPKEKCQCEATSTRYHILAAKMSVGLEPVQTNRAVNLRLYRKTAKRKLTKKTARKQPRANDYELEFEPAPDSEFSLNIPMKLKVEKTPSTTGINNTPKNTITNPTPISKRKRDLSVIEEESELETDELPTVICNQNHKQLIMHAE